MRATIAICAALVLFALFLNAEFARAPSAIEVALGSGLRVNAANVHWGPK